MSHTDECPDYYDAKREGSRAFERGDGYYRNPYRDDEGGCDEAARAWGYGYRSAEERHEEEQAEQRAAERRTYEQRLEEEAYYAALDEQREHEVRMQEEADVYYASQADDAEQP